MDITSTIETWFKDVIEPFKATYDEELKRLLVKKNVGPL